MKTSRTIACVLVSVLVACSAQGGNSLPTPTSDVPSGGGDCSALCARVVTTPGCTTDMNGCLQLCGVSQAFVPAACQSQYSALNSCGNSSPIMCNGPSDIRFTNCESQRQTLQMCISANLDAGVTPPRDATPPPNDVSGPPGSPTSPCASEMSGSSRDCGWNPGVNLTCTPGQMVLVGCNSTAGSGAACTAPLGVCSGDTVLRVCSGSAPCSGADEIESADDTCGTCPVATITCPASGMIHVLTGPYRTTTTGTTCTPALRPLNLS